MNPSLERALTHLNIVINTSTGLAHPLDVSATKELFNYLHSLDIPLEYQSIYDWTQSKGWAPRHSEELARLGEKIGNGGQVRVKHPGRLNEKLKEELRSLK